MPNGSHEDDVIVSVHFVERSKLADPMFPNDARRLPRNVSGK